MMPRDDHGRFLSGNKGGGRPKGARNRFASQFVVALQADFEKHGTAAIQKLRNQNITGYFRTIVAIMPKDLIVNIAPDDDLDNMTPEELEAELQRLIKEIKHDPEFQRRINAHSDCQLESE